MAYLRHKSAALIQMSLISALAAGSTQAWAQTCQVVQVVSNARDIVDCPSDVEADFCIVRTSIVDRSGLFTGRLKYFEDSSKGSGHPQDSSISIYSGLSRITTEEGTLDLQEHGVFDSDSAEFAAIARVGGGTGELSGYSGTVISSGNAQGTGRIDGTICKE